MAALTAGLIAGTALAGVAGSAMQASAIGDAADKQQAGAAEAARIQAESNKYAIDEQRRQYDQEQKNWEKNWDFQNQAYQFQKSDYERQIADRQPWVDAGKSALPTLQNLANDPGSFSFNEQDLYADPSYKFNMQEGMKALERSAAARGGLMSGGTLKDISRFSQGLASNEFSNAYNRAYSRYLNDRDTRFNRLASIAGIGNSGFGSGPAGPQMPTGNMAQISGNISNIAQSGGQALSNIFASNANAQAASSLAKGNLWGNTLSNLASGTASNLMQYQAMNNMNNWMNRMAPPAAASRVDLPQAPTTLTPMPSATGGAGFA